MPKTRKWINRILAMTMATMLALPLAACSGGGSDIVTDLSKIDMTAWQYNSDDKVFYQTGIAYCSDPADENYEQLAVFVPGKYMDGTDNGDGTYTCELSDKGKVKGYTAQTAPVVMPINTPGYSAQNALTGYTDVTDYTKAGYVYVHAGCRGRDAGAPAGVTDLKAAIRYIRYCDDVLAGDSESIFTFGMSGGGAQSAVVGTAGDSDLYNAYLEQIGAVQGVSDAVLGSMCWCPITNLDTADAAYEWMMGSTRSGLTEEEQAISDQLAAAYAGYVNSAEIKQPNGTKLVLEESESGIYQAGSYYDYMKSEIEKSLNNFLKDTEFPYEVKSSGFGGGTAPDGNAPEGEEAAAGESIEEQDNITRTKASGGISLSGTYETAKDYIDALNANGKWVKYNEKKNTAKITSIADFVKALKNASKGLGAFDQFDAGQGENELFGYGDGAGAHFDYYLAEILNNMSSTYASAYVADISKTDSVGNLVESRVNMYTPMYYLLETQEGYQTSNVAKYWRIRSGINQGDCALSTEMNLALALENYEGVESVNFAAVWGQGHTEAERKDGDSTTNFIKWVRKCMKAQAENQ